MSEDIWEGKLDDPQSLNKYSYVRNNPVKYVDPTGKLYEISDYIDWSKGCISDCVLGSDNSSSSNSSSSSGVIDESGNSTFDPASLTDVDDIINAGITYGTVFSSIHKILGKNTSNTTNQGESIWTSTQDKSSGENAYGHWKAHGKEFPEISNAVQYVNKAKNFLNKTAEGVSQFVRKNGDTVKYEKKSNTFGVADKNGTPRSLFKPTQGVKYWNKIIKGLKKIK